MSDPVCAKKGSFPVELEPGSYYWCSCGRSQRQPFCDGSHAGTDFVPELFTVDEKQTVYLCGCKKTGNTPFCDGTHNEL